MIGPRHSHTLTLLPDGRTLVAGGIGSAGDPLQTVELYDVGLDYQTAWRPVLITDLSSQLLGQLFVATGTGFRGFGLAESSGGNVNSSATNYPLVQLYRLDNGQTTWLTTRAFSTTGLIAPLPVTGHAPGYAMVTVFVNGIPSIARLIVIDLSRAYLPLELN